MKMMTMTTMTKSISPENYSVAHEAAVLVNHDRRGMLYLTGQTRLDLIHRMSTQALNDLKSGEGAATVLTTDIGRIIDRPILYTTTEAVYMLVGEDHADALSRYLMRHVFFNDDFQLRDISAETAVFGVYGRQAGGMLVAAGFPEVDLPLHHWRQGDINGHTAYLHRTDPIAGDGFFVTTGVSDAEAVQAALLEAGLQPIDDVAYDYLRIEAGLPRFGRELTLDYIPLEANLWADVSFHKGCYIGQEIIARMESRGKLAKRLVRLRPSVAIEAGVEIMAAGRPVGTVTSASDGPAGPLAMGYVKTSALNESVELSAASLSLSVVDGVNST
jgi:tRNA-modifying protein YgfZ